VAALLDVITYSRIRPEDLYHTSRGGLAGGLGRALVFLNYPTAIIAIAIVILVADRTRWTWPAILAVALCAVIVVPGVVDQSDLDAKWINVVPAVGVLIALWSTRALMAMRLPTPVPIDLSIPLDMRVLIFTSAMAIVATLVFALAPALTASRLQLVPALKDAQSAPRHRRLRAHHRLDDSQSRRLALSAADARQLRRTLGHPRIRLVLEHRRSHRTL